FLDQSLPINLPERKGINLADYLFSLKYTGREFSFLSETGDIEINETQNTVQNLARRGGRLSLKYKNLGLDAFNVRSEEVFGFIGGVGIGKSADDHIMGVSGEVGFFSNKLSLRTIYVTGGEEEVSYGYWRESGAKKGKAFGFLLKTDPLDQRLTAEAEIDISEFDADTSDEFSAESDKAYKLRVGGVTGKYSYEALYEYTGPDYEVIGNQGLQRDMEGFTINTGANFQTQSVNLSFARINDNVKKEELFPRVYTYQGMVDYRYNGLPILPIGINYQKSILDSSMEPEFTFPMRTDTDTISGTINYMKGKLNLGLQADYSFQNDRTSTGNDTTATTLSFTPAYSFSEHISITPNLSFNRSKYHFTDVRTDTYTVNLDLMGDAFSKKITYELASSYNKIKSNDSLTDQDSINGEFRIAYILGERLWRLMNPLVGIRGLYNRMEDRVWEQANEELVLFLVLTTTMPFSL
ncbi:MAG: hypothetical protein ACE5IH_06985, partial [Thermodesulfobacteriota bacterium]